MLTASAALKQLQYLRQDFMAFVAHDLRTPLQSVLLQLEGLMKPAAGEAASVPLEVHRAEQVLHEEDRRKDGVGMASFWMYRSTSRLLSKCGMPVLRPAPATEA
jgi:signal transduction histidine kinase